MPPWYLILSQKYGIASLYRLGRNGLAVVMKKLGLIGQARPSDRSALDPG